MSGALDFGRLIEPVAKKLLGEPNRALSRNGTLRWGTHGSLKVDLGPGCWHDKEADAGGGTIDLIMREQRCDKAGALAWLEREGLIEPRDRDPDMRFSPRPAASIFYDYVDENGEVRYRVERVPLPNGGRDFRQHGPDGRGGFHSARGCMSGVEPLPYRLPQLLASDPQELVWICSGEKDADRLASLGLVSTSNSGGEGNWRAELNRWFAGRRCVILEDNDPKGRSHVAKVKAELEGVAAEAAVLRLPDLAEKGDVSDWLAAGNTSEGLQDLAKAALAASGPAMLLMIDAGDFEGMDVPPREWMVDGWEPKNTCVLLTGLGATGKSLLTQQRMTCSAAALPFLGVEVRQGVSLYVTCEDDQDELHRRQAAIVSALGVPWGAIRGKLKLVSLKGQQNKELVTFDAEGRMRTTARWAELRATIKHIGATHVALDNVAHFFTGNENIRNQVAAFVGLLDGLAEEIQGGVLLLGHPNKAGAEYSGSTAWENQVRARLYLSHDEGEGGVVNPDARTLTNSKPNYAKRGEAIRFIWHQWAFTREDDLPPSVAREIAIVAADNAHNDNFLACLRERVRQRRAVSERPSSTYAPKIFAGMPEAKGSRKRDLVMAMDRLFRTGHIERGKLWLGSDRKWVEGLRETAGDREGVDADDFQETAEICGKQGAGDRAGDRAGDVRETAGNYTRETAGNVRETSPHTPIGAGGPTEAAPLAPNGALTSYRRVERPPILAPGETGNEPVPGFE